MMNEENETDFIGWGIKKTSEDKLTYKNIIADAINWCRKMRGKTAFKNAVEGLVDIIYFNVPGYKFTTELEEIRNELEEQKEIRKEKEIEKQGRNFYRNVNKAKFKIAQGEWYWNEYFKKIIQLLAAHNLLIETEKMTKVRIKKPELIEDGVSEEPTRDIYY